MGDRAAAFPSLPLDTVQAAAHMLAPDSPYRVLAHHLEAIFTESRLDQHDMRVIGDPAQFLQRSIVTWFQAVEQLTDGQAGEATRKRIDWKYALHLPLKHPGFHAHALCLFRQELFVNPAARSLFGTIQAQVNALDCWPGGIEPGGSGLGGSEPGGSDEEPAKTLVFVCNLNHTDCMGEAMEQALAALAGISPEWLRRNALPHWYMRYPQCKMAAGTTITPQTPSQTEMLFADVRYLLQMLAQTEARELVQLVEVRRLRCAWQRQGKLCRRDALLDNPCKYCTLHIRSAAR